MQPTTTPTATATPRKSRRRWYILGFLLLVAATPVAWYFIAAWVSEREMAALLAEMDAEDPGWRWPDILAAMPPIPAQENSVAQIFKVYGLARTPADFNPGPKWDNAEFIHNARLTDEQVKAAEIAFGRCDPTLREEARKLKDLPRGRYQLPVDGDLFAVGADDMQKSRTTIYVLQVGAALRAQEGDMDGAAESCQAMLNTAGSLKGHPSLIGLLVRIAEQHIAIDAVERVLAQGAVSEPQLKKLQELFQREADDDGMYQALRGERAALHQMYSDIQDGKSTVSQMIGGNSGGPANPSATGRLLDAFPNVILKDYPDYLRTMNANIRACKLEPNQRAAEMSRLEQEARGKGGLLSRMMLPALSKFSDAPLRSQAYLRCAITAIAAERFRLKNGAWPHTLDELVTDGLLARVPTDPFDSKLLRWKRTPTGAIVYSVGRDRIDNGGNLNRKNIMADGVDFGFELWDSPNMRGVPAPVAEK
jgi:hypothetical protein